MVEVARKQARRGRLAEDDVGTLRRMAGDAGARRERRRGVPEVAADPVLRTAPRAGPGAGVAGRAVQPRAMSGEVEGGGPPGAADPAGGRVGPLALVTGQATRRRRAAGEVGLPARPCGGRSYVAREALGGRGRVIELDAGRQ